MRYIPEFGSRFRILKGGKISLVVSALLVGNLMVSEVSANSTNNYYGKPLISSEGVVDYNTSFTWQSFNDANLSINLEAKPGLVIPDPSGVDTYGLIGDIAVDKYSTNTLYALGLKLASSDVLTSAKLYKYDNNSWVEVIDSMQMYRNKYKQIAVNGANNNSGIYVAYVEGLLLKVKWNNPNFVMGANLNNQSTPAAWDSTNGGFTLTGSEEIDFKLNPADDVPYLSIKRSNGDIEVYKLDFDNNVWTQVGTTITAGADHYGLLAFDYTGKPYVAYRTTENTYTVRVKKFDGSSWADADDGTGITKDDGDSGLANTPRYDYLTFAIVDDTLYIGYKDYANSNKPMVKKLESNGSWTTVGDLTGGNSGGADYGEYMTLELGANNQLFAFYGDYDLQIKKLSNGVWEDARTTDSGVATTTHNLFALDSQNRIFVSNSFNESVVKTLQLPIKNITLNTTASGESYTYNGVTYTGAWGEPAIARKYIGDTITLSTLATPVREGYEFLGWKDAYYNTPIASTTIAVPNDRDLRLAPIWGLTPVAPSITQTSGLYVGNSIAGGNDNDTANKIFTDSSGNIYTVGISKNTTGTYNVFVMKFSSTGVLDTTYGTNGYKVLATKTFSSSPYSYLMDGENLYVSSPEGISKINITNDTLVSDFGTNGTMATDGGFSYNIVKSGENFYGLGIKFMPTNLNNGTYQPEAYIVKFSSNGLLDASFGTNGAIITDGIAGVGYVQDFASNLAVIGENIYVVGYSGKASGYPMKSEGFIAKYSATTGALATNFGASGYKLISDLGGIVDVDDMLNTITTDGTNLYVSGRTDTKLIVAKINPTTGDYDTSFNTTGYIVKDTITSASTRQSGSMITALDGSLYVGGSLTELISSTNVASPFIAKYSLNGVVDTTFDTDGYLVGEALPGFGAIRDIKITSSGVFFAGATAYDATANMFFGKVAGSEITTEGTTGGTDNTGGTTTPTTNVAPTITSTPNTIAKKNELYQYIPTATDANGDTLTWSLKSGTTLPNWLTGITTTVAKGVAGNTINGLNFVDGKLATEVKLKVYDTVFDASGNMYVNDGAHIRKIDKATGKIYNFVGMDEGYSTNKPAIEANIRGASGMTFDSVGNFYFADTDGHRIGGETNNVIRKIDTNGLITTIIGDPDSSNYDTYGMGGLATAANLIKPTDLHLNSDGTIYILDAGRSKILKVDTNGIINELQNTTYDIYQPKNMTVDNTGNIYVTTGHAIKKIVPGTGETTIAGTYYDYGNTGDGAVATASRLKNPSDVAIASNGDIYIADTGNNSIRKIDATTGNISTIKTNIYSPAGLNFDKDGNLFVTSGQSTDVRQVSQLYLDTFILQGTPSSFSDVNVSLVVTDGANPVEQTFSFVAGNTAPYNTNGIPATFNEEQAIGTTVATLTTNDNDSGSGDTFTYSLTCATPAADDGKFEIAGNLLKTKVVLDYETQSSVKVCVRTTDRGGLFADTFRTINLMNVTETTTGGTTGGTDTNTGGTTGGTTGGDTTDNTDTNTGGGDTTTPTTPTTDTTSPTATITLSDSTLTAGESSIVTITFSEEVNGLDLLDFRVMGGRLTNLAKSTTDGKIYTATFTPAPNLAINTNAITLTNGYKDTAGNQGVATTSPNYTINTYPAIDVDKLAVSKALQALMIPTNNWVTGNLTLPSTVTGSSATIAWTSSKLTVVGTYGAVTNAGVVTRGNGTDTYVILTATITSGSEIAKKPFTIFVPKAAATTTEQTKTITEKISIADAVGTTQTATAIVDDINVSAWATNTPSGFTTTISSNNQTVIGTDGTVSRPLEDTPVTLTIKTCENGSTTNCTEKTITVVVKKEVENTDIAKLEEAKEILGSNIITNDNLNLNDITKDVTLPTTIGGATIVWTSSNTDVIATNGTVTPKGSDVVVTLKATITVGVETFTKDFIVKVPAVGGDVATKLAEAKTTTAELESKVDITTGTTNPTRTSTIGFVTSGGTVEQKVDIKTDIFTSDITTGTSGEVITTIAPKTISTTNGIQEIKVVQNPNGTSTNNVTIKDREGNSKTTSLNFTPTNVNQEYKDDGSVVINVVSDTNTSKKSQILVDTNGTITNTILDDNNVALVSSTTQIQDASLFVSADGNVTIETVVATTLNDENTTATVTTTSSSTKVESSTKVGEAELKSSAEVTSGTTLSQDIESNGDVVITATAGGRSKKIKTTAQATTTHTVTNGSTETKATFDTAGLNITSNITAENVTTKVETDQTSPSTTSVLVGSELFEGVVITKDDGTSQTKFRITNTLTGDQRYVDSTVDENTPLPQGTNSTIKLVGGKLVIENKQTTNGKTIIKIGATDE
jgi:uncharacterized delta-60 repeat protein